VKAYVITIMDLEESVVSSNRCIESASQFGIQVEKFDAVTPKKNPLSILKKYSIQESDFDSPYSRKLNVVSCFLSHYFLWKMAIETQEAILILEHDAVFVSSFDMNTTFEMLLSLGKPSYGKYNVPKDVGVNTLVSKRYLPGAHAYLLKPKAAEQLVRQASIKAKYADTFINLDSFPWIQEYYPWPVICNDSFTTVQAELGCKAKHNFGNNFQIIY
jgi:GR25 family glycosyltransferase involved in LPS biosynthesis